MGRKTIKTLLLLGVGAIFSGCITNNTNSDYNENSSVREETTKTEADSKYSEYYQNEHGDWVDKVEEFETETFDTFTIQYPILDDGKHEVIVYEFETYDGKQVTLDATNIHQQSTFDSEHVGDYGDVTLKTVASKENVSYLFDGERYYIEDAARNLLTISKPIK